MELQQLRYVIAVSQELSFHKAALKVGITQPTLSQQIKKLEDELGVILFERSPQHVLMTQAGKKFIPYAIGALEKLNTGVLSITQDPDELSGTLSVAFIPTVGPYLIPKIIKHIKKVSPKLKLKLFEETTSELINNLKLAKFDLGFLALPIKDPSIVNKPLFTEPFYLAVPTHHPLANKRTIKPLDIHQEPLIMLKEGHCFRDQALDFCQLDTSHANLIFEGSSLTSVINLVSTGEGVTLVPHMALEHIKNRNVQFIPFQKPLPHREIGAIWRMTTPLDRNQKHLIEIITHLFT